MRKIIEAVCEGKDINSQTKKNVMRVEKLQKELNTLLDGRIKDIKSSIDFKEDASDKSSTLDDLCMELDKIITMVSKKL